MDIRFECFYAHFVLFLLCCVIYFSLLTLHFRSCLNPISILSASDVCECCIVLCRNPFCPVAIRCPSDVKYFWCERAIRADRFVGFTGQNCWAQTLVFVISYGLFPMGDNVETGFKSPHILLKSSLSGQTSYFHYSNKIIKHNESIDSTRSRSKIL